MSGRGNGHTRANVFTVISALVIIAIHYYVTLPVFNIHSRSSFTTLILYILIILGCKWFWGFVFKVRERTSTWNAEMSFSDVVTGVRGFSTFTKAGLGVIAALIVVMLIGWAASSVVFRASTYANVISVTEANFEDDMPETNEVTDIALMDTSSAIVIGNRALGSLSEVVSQYELSSQYTQINYENSPQKVSNLEYNGFFKWFNNRKDGVPGFVMVDPVKNTAKYVKLDDSIRYVESGYFMDDLDRKLRFSYPTKIFNSCYFEIDEEGNPWFVVSCLSANAGLFGAMDVNEVILFNPCDGSSEIYSLDEVPTWIDMVYTGTLACEKYNWQGLYAGGFINSFIGQSGCKRTTEDYGYIIRDDDVWYYTGVTSVISDESNIGFILTNARTGEYKYYSIVGAEEYSAMGAAEGEVQEKRYTASFPCLINVADQATYIMVLKDSNSLVKLYALVNVENYSFVVTAETQAEAIADYKRLLITNNIISSDTEIIEDVDEEEEEEIEETFTEVEVDVAEVRFADISGETYLYIVTESGELYKAKVADDETVMLIMPGNSYVLFVEDKEGNDIPVFAGWEDASDPDAA